MKTAGDVLYIVMPAYNEENVIASVVEDWLKVLNDKSENSRLVVADSGSSDKTHAVLTSLQKKHKKLKVISNTGKLHGPKVIALYNYALENNADYIFQTDSDGQTNPAEFDTFWNERHNYDAILGCRKKRGDGKIRALVEKTVCLLLRIFFGVNVPDANAPFRLMKASLLKKYIHKIPSDYDLPNIILTTYFVKFKNRVIFKEITFKPRQAGVNSINLKKIFRIGRESLTAFYQFRKSMLKESPKTEKSHRKLQTFFIILLFSAASFMIVSTSNSFYWKNGEPLTDSSVFLTIGEQMKAGEIPYKDTFDHKGPLLYFINYWGLLISESKGVFIFEFLAIFITLWFMYKIARLKVKSIPESAVLTLFAFTPFLIIYATDYGNLTEQYAMPFIAISLYIFLKYFIKKRVSNFDIFVVGASFACVLMLRINMAGIWGIFCLAIFIKNIINKEFKELRRNIYLFSLGALIILIPIVWYLLANNAFSDFINSYLKFNLSYSKADILPIVSVVLHFINSLIITLSLTATLYYAFRGENKTEKNIFRLYLLGYVVLLFSACMSGRLYQHYGMILAPITIFPLATVFHKTGQLSTNNANIKLILILFLAAITSNTWLNTATTSVDTLHAYLSDNQSPYILMDELCGFVNDITAPSDQIIVYGNWNYPYLKCNRLPASKYSYQFPISDVDPKILDEFYQEISQKRPKIFIVAKPDNRVFDFLENNNYKEKLLANNNVNIRVFYTNP